MKRMMIGFSLLAFVAIGTACESKKPESGVSSTNAPPASATGNPSTDTMGPMTMSDTASPLPLLSGTVAITAREFSFAPDRVRVTAGQITFKIKNDGKLEHEFEIFKGETLVNEVEDIAPGLTRDLKVDLAPGDYTFACKLAGHEESGQKGQLTVV